MSEDKDELMLRAQRVRTGRILENLVASYLATGRDVPKEIAELEIYNLGLIAKENPDGR